MAYAHFTSDKPVIADTGAQIIDRTRENLMALRDAVVGGLMPGWGLTATAGSGTAEQPQYLVYAKGTERVRLTITWGTTAGAQYNPQVVLVEYSANSGGAYDSLGTLTYTFDVNGNVTSTAWS